MISIKENIKSCRNNMNQLLNQRNEITSEILRIEGAIRVFMDMEKAGISEIPLSKNPLETSEVIDALDVRAAGSEPKQTNDTSL